MWQGALTVQGSYQVRNLNNVGGQVGQRCAMLYWTPAVWGKLDTLWGYENQSS